jgi:hypothetical protein
MKKIRKKRIVGVGVISAALIGILAVGCGDGESSPAASGNITVDTGSLSKAVFIEKADAICEKGNEEVQDGVEAVIKRYGQREYSEPLLVAKAPELVETVLAPSFESQIDEIRDLGAPKGDEAEVGAILTAMSDVIEDAKERPKDFARSGEPFAKAARLAQSYGLEACALS